MSNIRSPLIEFSPRKVKKKSSKEVLQNYQHALKYIFNYEKKNFLSNEPSNLLLDSNDENSKYLVFPDKLVSLYYLCNYDKEKITSKLTNCIRSCVSESRIRFIDEDFNLDLTFITKRVIAMGYPANKCQEMLYRNSLKEVKRFFKERLDNKVKVSCLFYLNRYIIYALK